MFGTLTTEKQTKNRLADTQVANLIKVKLTENTNLDRQYSFIDFSHFSASDAKVGGCVGGFESLMPYDAN